MTREALTMRNIDMMDDIEVEGWTLKEIDTGDAFMLLLSDVSLMSGYAILGWDVVGS